MRLLGIGAWLLLSGCAGQRYVSAGRVLAERGDWVGAYEQLEAAVALRPGSGRLAQRLDEGRRRALEQLRAGYTGSLRAGDVPAAFRSARRANAIAPETPWVGAALEEVVSVRRATVDDALAAGRVAFAYRTAVETRSWFPREPRIIEGVEASRRAVLSAMDQALASDAFGEALAAVDLMAEVEPRGEHGAHRQRVERLWAASLRERAQTASRRGRYAEATVLSALVTTLSDARADLEALRRQRDRFLDREGLVFDVAVLGSDPRTRFVRQQLAAGLPDVPGVSWQPDASAPTVGGTLRLAPAACTSVEEGRPARHTYVAGVVQVPNAEHVQLTGQLDATRREARATRRQLRVQEERLAVAREDLEYARADAVPIRRALAEQQQRLDQAIASQERAIRAVEDAEAAVAEVQRHRRSERELFERIRRLRTRVGEHRAEVERLEALLGDGEEAPDASGSPRTPPAPLPAERPGRTPSERPGGQRPPPPGELEPSDDDPTDGEATDEELQAALVRARRERRSAATALQAAVSERQGLQPPSPLVVRLAGEVEARRQALSRERRPEVEERYRNLEHRAREVDAEIRRRLAIVREEERAAEQLAARLASHREHVHRLGERLARIPPTVGQEVLDTYDYTVVRHTRTCTVVATLATRSRDLPALDRRVTSSRETWDDVVEAVPSVGLDGDPLELPVSDSTLVHHGDGDLVETLVPYFRQQVETWKDGRVAAIATRATVESRTRAALAAFLADPQHPDEAVRRHLEEAFGLADLRTLLR